MTRLHSLLTRCSHAKDVKKLQKAIPELRKHPARTVEWLFWMYWEDQGKSVETGEVWPVSKADMKWFAAWLREEV